MIEINGTIQPYHWGSTDAIPAILGTLPNAEPQAEYWLGAHTSAPSHTDSGEALDAWLSEHPEELGATSRAAFGDQLPFLLKILSAARPLSLQAHPTRAQAEEGFAAEQARGIALDDPKRTFKDPWPKPEMLVAISRVDALCGFRDPHETARLFDFFDLPSQFHTIIGPLTQRGGEAGLAEVFLDALSLSGDRLALVTELVAAAAKHHTQDGPVGEFARTVVELDEHHPSDPGIIAALLLNRITLNPGDAIYLPAGNMHAYLRGTGIEVMANSDNVLRGGLTSKHIDVDALVQVVDFAARPTTLVEQTDELPGLTRYLTPAPEFALWQATPGGGAPVMAPATPVARIVLVVGGHVVASSAQSTIELVQGRAAFLPAGESVQLDGNGVCFVAAAGL